MGSFYSGFGGYKSFLGHCDDGVIYRGNGNSTPIGRYENGNIYNQFKEHVGSYSGGSIYNQFHEHIASYDNGIVYNKYLNVAFGKEQIGSYEDNPAEAAALVLLFLGGNAVNGDDEEKDTPDPAPSPTPPPSGDSNDGCLSTLFYGIGVAIGALFRYVIFPVLKVYFLAFWLSSVAQMTWVTFAMILLCTTIFSFAGVIAFYIVAIPVGILYISFFPYWAILMWQKIKKQMTWKEVCSYYWKWFLKGPFAYLELARILNNNNSMPKVASLLDKIIGWFKKVFKKK